MDGKEAIISNILQNAQAQASAILKRANDEKAEQMQTTRVYCEKIRNDSIEKADRDSLLLIDRRKSASCLEKGKSILFAKQQVLDNIYKEAIQKILNMTDNIYRDFIGALIKKYAENQDVVMICERDSKRLHSQWLEKISEEIKMVLTLSSDFHSHRGGVILASQRYDKNLTLDVLINEMRAEYDLKLVKTLFN